VKGRSKSAKAVRVQLLAAFAAQFAAMSDRELADSAHMLDPETLTEEACAAVAATFAHCRERVHPNPETQQFLEAKFALWSAAAGIDISAASPALVGAA